MIMKNDIYTKVNKNRKTPKDRSVRRMVIIAVLLCIVPVSLIVYSVSYSYRYREYMQDLTSSFAGSETSGRFLGSVTVDGERVSVTKEQAGSLFFEINRAGMGRKCKVRDTDEGIKVSFTDGAYLTVSPIMMKIENNEEKEGVYIDYRDPYGRHYAYETVDIIYTALRKAVRGEW